MVSTSPTDNPTATIRVTNLPNETSEVEINDLFSSFGEIRQVRLLLDNPARRFQGVGYVDLVPEQAAKAVDRLDGHLFNGSIIRLAQVSDEPAELAVETDDATQTLSDDEVPSNLLRRHYEIASVELASMPADADGAEWYRYVLVSGTARIVGYRKGTLEAVTEFAQSCAEDFNMRNAVGWKTMSGSLRKQGASSAAQRKAR